MSDDDMNGDEPNHVNRRALYVILRLLAVSQALRIEYPNLQTYTVAPCIALNHGRERSMWSCYCQLYGPHNHKRSDPESRTCADTPCTALSHVKVCGLTTAGCMDRATTKRLIESPEHDLTLLALLLAT